MAAADTLDLRELGESLLRFLKPIINLHKTEIRTDAGDLTQSIGDTNEFGTVETRLSDLLKLSGCSAVFFLAVVFAGRVVLPRKLAHNIPSNIHAALASVLSVWVCLSCQGLKMREELRAALNGEDVDFIHGHSDVLYYAVAISNGYFLVDTLLMFLDNEATVAFLIHHIVGSITFSAAVILGVAEFFVVYLLTTELSTPFLNMSQLSKDGTAFNLFASALFALSFLLIRLAPVPLYLYLFYGTYGHLLKDHGSPIIAWCTICVCIPPVLNGIWSMVILEKVAAVVCGSTKKEKEQ